MLENLFTNVFGRPKGRSSSGRNSQHDQTPTTHSAGPMPPHMTGPFSMSAPQMPQPSNLPYPPAPYPQVPYPAGGPDRSIYPSLPFSQPFGASNAPGPSYPTGTLATSNQISPLDSVPFEAKLTLNNSTNLVSLDQLFKEIKKAADVVDRADAYLRSNQSDYDFRTEQGLISQ